MRHGEYRTADFYRIKSQKDALYYAAEIPSVYWKDVAISPTFLTICSNADYDQETKFKKLIGADAKIFSKPYLFFISSGNEDSASLVSYSIAKTALVNGIKIQVTDSAMSRQEKCENESVFFLTNVFDKVTDERLMHIRDWCKKHQDCFRIIVMAGDPYEFGLRVHLTPTAMFYINITKSSVKEFV